MADNVTASAGTGDGSTFVTASFSWSGDTANACGMFSGILSGSEGSWTYTLNPGGAGAVTAGVPRVTHASNDPVVTLLTAMDVDTSAMVVDLAAIEVLATAGNNYLSTIQNNTTGGTALLATIDTAAGNMVTSLQIIDDAIYADDADWVDGTSKHILTGGLYQSSPQTITDGDVGPVQVNSRGYQIVTVDGTVTVDAHAVTNAGTFVVQEDGAALTALQVMDDWDESDRAKVNIIVGQAGITAGAGAVAANTPRVTHASDDPAVALLVTIDEDTGAIKTAVEILDNAISGSEMQVDVVASLPAGDNNIGNVDVASALPAGANAIGKLAANSGVDIGDVDVLSVAAGTNLIGDVGIQGRTTGGLTPYYNNDIDETAVAVKAGTGTLYAIHAINTTAAPLFLQFFNVAQGGVTVGTTTPTMQFIVPGDANSDGAGFTFSVPQGIAFATAITAACSTDSEGDGAPSANACHVNLMYK